MENKKILTKRKKPPMRITTILLTETDCRQWLAAASLTGQSRAELIREALREKTNSILSRSAEVKVS
jgi:hypothetical protein